jgi:hypothetical protein
MSGVSGLGRVRWAAIGAAVAVSLGAGGMGIVNATISSGSKAVYVPIAPCRLADTRPAPDTVGPKNTPIGAGQTHTFTVRGSNGNCSIPEGATAVVANVTAVGPTARSFMTIWPADQPQPNASSLNYSAGQAPFPNAVTVTLSGDGKINVANKNGSVNVIVDIAGYYEDHNHDDRYYTKTQTDQKIVATQVFTGTQGVPLTLTPQRNFDKALDQTVTITSSGQLVIHKRVNVTLNCADTSSARRYYLLINGTPIRNSLVLRNSSSPELNEVLVGSTEVLEPGDHVVGVGGECTSSAASGFVLLFFSPSTILLVP